MYCLAALEDLRLLPWLTIVCKVKHLQIARCQLLQKWIDVASEVQLRRISVALSACFAAVSRDKSEITFV